MWYFKVKIVTVGTYYACVMCMSMSAYLLKWFLIGVGLGQCLLGPFEQELHTKAL